MNIADFLHQQGDELVEVTPKSMRMRKVILDHLSRKRSNKD